MSTELLEYVRGIGESVFDVAVGYVAGAVIDLPFNKPGMLPIASRDDFWKVMVFVLLETAASATAVLGLRRLMYMNDGEENLMGGMFFIQSMMMAQCGYWANLRALLAYATGALKLVAPANLDGGEGEQQV